MPVDSMIRKHSASGQHRRHLLWGIQVSVVGAVSAVKQFAGPQGPETHLRGSMRGAGLSRFLSSKLEEFRLTRSSFDADNSDSNEFKRLANCIADRAADEDRGPILPVEALET